MGANMVDNKVFKICHKHGKLTGEDLIKSGIICGNQKFKCKLCQKESHKKHYLNNISKIKDKQKEYRKNNKEKVRKTRNESKIRMQQKKDIKYNEEKEKRINDKTYRIARSKISNAILDILKIEKLYRKEANNGY